jgi:2'-5' RNA ligase superfamily
VTSDIPLDGARPLETFVTLILAPAAPAVAEAHDELYPERVPEGIPLSLTLLYPWIPAASVTDVDVAGLRAFFAERPPLEFALNRLAVFPDAVVYAVPEPDAGLRATLRALWAHYPECPPYGRPGSDPPPHATLGRLTGDHAITLERAERRVQGILPASFLVTEATLMEELEPDRYAPREVLPFGSS